MATMFACEVDGRNFADSVCVCAFPMPSLCQACVSAHCSKPGSHYILPIALKDKVTSVKDFERVQRRLNQLNLTNEGLRRVLGTFERMKEEVEASCAELVQMLTQVKDTYIGKIAEAETRYEEYLNWAMHENYGNAWRRKEDVPSDPMAAMIWTFEPGESEFKLAYGVTAAKDLVSNLLQVQFSLPLAGFPRYSSHESFGTPGPYYSTYVQPVSQPSQSQSIGTCAYCGSVLLPDRLCYQVGLKCGHRVCTFLCFKCHSETSRCLICGIRT